MTTINLNAFTDGLTATGTDVSENFYDPQAAVVATSFEALNGWLDSGNVEANWQMDTYHIQPNALSEGKMVGGTVDQDYFGTAFFDRFNAYEKINGAWTWVGDEGNLGAGFTPAQSRPNAEHRFFQAIPGGGVTFYVPYENAFVLLTWNIRWTHDGEATMNLDNPENPTALDEQRAAIRLFVKTPTDEASRPPGSLYADNYRRVAGQVNIQGGATVPDETPSARFDFNRHREWSGHYIIGAAGTGTIEGTGDPARYGPGANTGTTRGWYSASLRIATSAKQARVQVRSMRYICFKLEAPTAS
jgi:hypothetical protein